MSSKAFLLAAGIASASAAKWTIVDGTAATTLVGIGANTDVEAVAGAAQNGVGALIERYDGEKWPKEQLQAGMLLDAGVSDSYTVATSVLPILISKDKGATYTTVDSIGGACQSATVTEEAISLVGGFIVADPDTTRNTNFYGVARSTDGGETWSSSEIPDGSCRYGAFPSSDVWYVSNGMWGSDEDALSRSKTHFDTSSSLRASFLDYSVSARATVGGVQKGGVSFRGRGEHTKATTNATDTTTGWWGSITKTTDGGKTWSTVFKSDPENDYWYFNSIACSSETHCVAVAEGDASADGGYVALAFVTFDGGVTWNNALTSDVLPDNVVSIMGAAWVNDDEGWLAATAKSGPALSGVFFKTTDGGKTYKVEQTLENCFVMDMDFANGVGFATCSSSSGSSSSVAIYA